MLVPPLLIIEILWLSKNASAIELTLNTLYQFGEYRGLGEVS